MPCPYFRKSSWPSFTYQGKVYPLTHLDEFEFSVVDTDNVTRNIAVTFTDHCFTRKPEPGDDPDLDYPGCSRNPGCFCFERYQLSLSLATTINGQPIGKVWMVQGEHFAILPTQTLNGQTILYGIIFSLSPVSGLPVDLRMNILSAHPIKPTDRNPDTFGETRFRHLVALRMKRKFPPHITGDKRNKPQKPGKTK